MMSPTIRAVVVVGMLASPGWAATPTAPNPTGSGAAAKGGDYTPHKGPMRAKLGLRVLGMKIGEPEVFLGPVEVSKSGATTRTLRFQGGTWGKLRRLYPFDTTSVAILDGTTYRPKRTVIKMLRGTSNKTIDMRFKGNRVVGSVTHDGEVTKLDEVHDQGMVDTISSVAWLVARDLKLGESDHVPHHSGSTRYRLWFEADKIEEVRVPAGTFEAQRIVCSLYRWEEGLPAPKTKPTVDPTTVWSIWLGRDRYRTPVKVVATVSILGDIVVELEARRFK